MKKYNHPIDDFFREALEDHQMAPSDKAKKAFLKDAIQETLPKKKGRTGLILLSAFLLLVSTGISIWAISLKKQSSNTGRDTSPSQAAIQLKDQKTGSANKIITEFKVPNSISSENKTTKSNQHAVNQQLSPGSSQQYAEKQPDIVQPGKKQKPDKSTQKQHVNIEKHVDNPMESALSSSFISGKNEPATTISSLSSPSLLASSDTIPAGNTSPSDSPQPVEDLKETALAQVDTTVNPVSSNPTEISKKVRTPSNWIPTLGVYYSPEWMFNTLEGTKFVNNFGVEGTFHFDRFSVRTGVGLSVAKGTNELVVEYNDFLGAYSKLDSINFTWSDPIHNYTPTMFMSKQDVWDSLMKLDYPKVVKRYTYLQIPFIMGYDFWQTEKIAIGLRVGPVMSILLASKQLSAPYDPGTKRIISINDIAPEQVSLNWQAMAGINTSVRISKELQFDVEPWMRYYFNSVYEKPLNNTKPWSIGLRATFVIKF